MLHKRSESSPNFPTSLSQAFQDISLEQRLLSSALPSRMSSPNTRRRLLKRQQSAVIPQAKIEPDGRVAAPEFDDFASKIPHNEVPRRPTLKTRNSSYSKRHASFDSPREVPLPPSPSLQRRNPILHANTAPYSLALKEKGVDPLSSSKDYSIFEHGTDNSSETSSSLPSASSAPTSPSPSRRSFTDLRVKPKHMSPRDPDSPGDHHHSRDSDVPEISHASALPQGSSPVFPFSRPYSLPDAHSNSYTPATLPVPSSTNPAWPDRASCASLPLPMQTPYSTLPKVPPLDEDRELNQTDPPPADRPESKLPDKTSTQRFGPRPLFEQPSLFSSGSPPTAIHPTPILSRSSSLSQSGSSYPPPTPPTILAPSPPPVETRTQAPYEPFLCNAPPPEDSWIAVETSTAEYTLIVRLPGFKRDGITLATRRRRILHVVADSWEPSGGHFERRISFGYDADLTQVRAEFDGELLRIVIPRRLPPMNAWYVPPVARP